MLQEGRHLRDFFCFLTGDGGACWSWWGSIDCKLRLSSADGEGLRFLKDVLVAVGAIDAADGTLFIEGAAFGCEPVFRLGEGGACCFVWSWIEFDLDFSGSVFFEMSSVCGDSALFVEAFEAALTLFTGDVASPVSDADFECEFGSCLWFGGVFGRELCRGSETTSLSLFSNESSWVSAEEDSGLFFIDVSIDSIAWLKPALAKGSSSSLFGKMIFIRFALICRDAYVRRSTYWTCFFIAFRTSAVTCLFW